jgi:hypothetical protein
VNRLIFELFQRFVNVLFTPTAGRSGFSYRKLKLFRIEEKTVTPNPFYVEEESQVGLEEEPAQSGLGEQLANRKNIKRRKEP